MALESHTGLSQEQGDLGTPGHGTNDWSFRGNHPSSHCLDILALQALRPAFLLLENTDSQKVAANALSSSNISPLVDPFLHSSLQAFIHSSHMA